jgi:pimeloyl-ACP methyl ester carboxylesterase
VADAAARGLRLISYDRPGYGGSTPHPGYSIADCADDVRAICAALEIDRLAMWGISGGGPYVLACAALLPDLVVAAASLASPAPYGAEGLDWFAGMGPDDAAYNRLLLTDPEAARAKTDKDREEALATSASDLAQAFESALSPADVAALNAEMAEYFTYCDHEGLAPGSQGLWDDNCALVRPWDSSCLISPFPCWSCTAGRTSSCPSGMANGSPPTSPRPKPGCSTATGT